MLPKYKQLEKAYANYVGTKYAVSCNSGTSALHLALLSLGIGAGDEVIVPDFTMAACGFAVSYTGATPVFVDCDDQLNIDVNLLNEKITENTKAIMVVHIYGRLANMSKIISIARLRGIPVIEDACEAQGAVYRSMADITCYSFYQNKIIAAEEGGICTTNKQHLADKMNYLKNMAFDRDHSYYHDVVGYNYRMPESQAALALSSLKKAEKNIEKRNKISEWYDAHLPENTIRTQRDVVWVYDINVPFNKREEIIKTVSGSRYPFRPLSTMPMWRNKETGIKALFYSQNIMYLPVNTNMTLKDVKNIAENIRKKF